jgi:hypothetical protein
MNRPSVLIIGTDDPVRKALAASVERAGCHATVCNEEPSTITATLTLQPDVILLCDNRDETSRAIRDSLNGTSTPVIVQAPRLDPETFDPESNSGQGSPKASQHWPVRRTSLTYSPALSPGPDSSSIGVPTARRSMTTNSS